MVLYTHDHVQARDLNERITCVIPRSRAQTLHRTDHMYYLTVTCTNWKNKLSRKLYVRPQQKGLILISDTIISMQTAVEAPPDPISEWNNLGHREKSFWNGHWKSCEALGNV